MLATSVTPWCLETRCAGPHGDTVSRWRSPSGIRLVVVRVPGPLVHSYFCLATETDNDDGLPHTLEHLTFLGSEDHPYKGILDIYANRCYASGTNAWTQTDHTAFTLKTAGSRGTLAMLPVYLDHILYPLLTEHGYVTEVHHITGKGEDAGVVYSEMLGSENDANSRCNLQLMRALYPKSGYSYQTGGILKNLRDSTSNEKVKKYHADYYRPENITIIITGQINDEDIFKVLQPMEDKIMNKNKLNPLPEFTRPWQTSIAPLEETKVIHEKYPTDSEDCGVIMVAWHGPKVNEYESIYEYTGCSILLRYLCETAVAPLQKALVEIENPYASDVSLNIFENSVAVFQITLENVPIALLNEALPKLQNVISSMTCTSNTLELDRINTIIEKQLRANLSNIENSPHDTMTFDCISDMLYSTDIKGFELRLNKKAMFKKLMTETSEWWEKLLKKYFEKPHIAVIGEPSIELMEKMAEEESARVEKQKSALGVNGLKEKEIILQEAMNSNDREPPLSVTTAVGVNNCDDIETFSMDSWTTEDPECPHFDIKNLPFYARIHHIKSEFAYIRLLMNTCMLTTEERKHLSLIVEVLTQTSFDRNHYKMEYNILVEDIERLTNSLNINIGVSESGRFEPTNFHNTITLYAQCEPEKYEEVIDLLWHILKKTHFERRRVLIVAQKMMNDITRIRREGDTMATCLIQNLVNKKETNICASSILHQNKFLNKIITMLEKNDSTSFEFLDTLDSIRKKLVNEQNIWLHFAGDLKRNKYATDPWKVFKSDNCSPCSSIKCEISMNDHQMLVDSSKRQGQGCVVGMGGINSIYLNQYSPGPLSYTDPDLPALYVTLQYFTQLEGQLWKSIRGAGLAYSFGILAKPLEGFIFFELFKASDVVQSFEKTKNIIETFLKTEKWDDNLFISAKSSLIYQMYEKESSPDKLIQQSLNHFYQGVDEGHTKKFVKSIVELTQSDAMIIAKKWLPGIFDANLATTVIVCNTSKVDEIHKSFNNLGYSNLKAHKTLEDSHLGIIQE